MKRWGSHGRRWRWRRQGGPPFSDSKCPKWTPGASTPNPLPLIMSMELKVGVSRGKGSSHRSHGRQDRRLREVKQPARGCRLHACRARMHSHYLSHPPQREGPSGEMHPKAQPRLTWCMGGSQHVDAAVVTVTIRTECRTLLQPGPQGRERALVTPRDGGCHTHDCGPQEGDLTHQGWEGSPGKSSWRRISWYWLL